MANNFQEALKNSIAAVDRQLEWVILEDSYIKNLHVAIQKKDLGVVQKYEKRAQRAERQLSKFGKKLRDELGKLRKANPALKDTLAEIEVKLGTYEEQLAEKLIDSWFGKKGTIPTLLRIEPMDWNTLQNEISSALVDTLDPLIQLLRQLKEQLKKQSDQYYYDIYSRLKSNKQFMQDFIKEFGGRTIEKVMDRDDADILKLFLDEWRDRVYYQTGKEEKEQRRLFGLRLQKPPVNPIYVRFEYSDITWPSKGEKDFLPFEPERGRWPQISVLKLEQLERPIKKYGGRSFTELTDTEKAAYLNEYFGLRPEQRGVNIKDRLVVMFSFLNGEKFTEEPYGYYVNIKLESEQRPLIMVLKTKPDIRVTRDDIKEAREILKKSA